MHEPKLTDVPETMLWTLRNRAIEAQRPDRIIEDPKCIEIYKSMDYDFERNFGKAEPSHAVRSVIFDKALRGFIADNPNGVIVNLGEGLETQRYRIASGRDITWITVDLPESIAIRERFIAPDKQHQHLAMSALDQAWFEQVPEHRPVFVTAQGLFMYLEEAQVGELIAAMAKRWPGMWLMFDHIPRWLSRKTLSRRGFGVTSHYRVPAMPWGIRPSEVQGFVTKWAGPTLDYENPFYDPKGLHYAPRGIRRLIFSLFLATPLLSSLAAGICKIRVAPS